MKKPKLFTKLINALYTSAIPRANIIIKYTLKKISVQL